jgi:hypothetical protein
VPSDPSDTSQPPARKPEDGIRFRSAMTPLLRLGLLFFEEPDGQALRTFIRSLRSDRLPWEVVDQGPYDALLLARGPRAADAEHLAVLRLSADAEAHARRSYGDAMPPIALRKPFNPMHLRMVLEMAAASVIPHHIEGLYSVTQPRAPVVPVPPLTLF